MKIYCQKCNSPTEYSDIKPKFCAFCSNPFVGRTATTIAKTPPRQSSKKRIRVVEEEEYEEEIGGPFYVDKFTIEPLSENLRPTVKFEDVASQQPVSDKNKIQRPKGKRISKKKFAEQWASEVQGKNSKEIGA